MNCTANPDVIRQLRANLGLTQESLAERADLSHRTMQRIEAARHVRASTLAAVAETLNVSVSDILSSIGSGERTYLRSLFSSQSPIRRAMDLRISHLMAQPGFVAMNSTIRIDAVEIGPCLEGIDEAPAFVEIRQRLEQLGFMVEHGTWDEGRLLARYPHQDRDALYVIHHRKPTFANRLFSILKQLNFGPSVSVLSAYKVSSKSISIETTSVVQYADLVLAYRPASDSIGDEVLTCCYARRPAVEPAADQPAGRRRSYHRIS